MEVNSEGSEEGREIQQENLGGMKSCSTTVNNTMLVIQSESNSDLWTHIKPLTLWNFQYN